MANRKVSSAEDKKGGELKNIELDRKTYGRLLILACLWKHGSPSKMVADHVNSVWSQRGEFIPKDLSPEDFEELADYLRGA